MYDTSTYGADCLPEGCQSSVMRIIWRPNRPGKGGDRRKSTYQRHRITQQREAWRILGQRVRKVGKRGVRLCWCIRQNLEARLVNVVCFA